MSGTAPETAAVRDPGRAQAPFGGRPWIMTASGRALPIPPQPEEIEFRALAVMLAKINRYSGATTAPYSVAQHSVFVAELLSARSGDPQLALAGLLHDVHEVFLGDMQTPVKRELFRHDSVHTGVLAREIDMAVMGAAGLGAHFLFEQRAEIAWADKLALATEVRDLMPAAAAGTPAWDIELPPPAARRLRPWNWQLAEERFLETYDQLQAAIAAGRAGLGG